MGDLCKRIPQKEGILGLKKLEEQNSSSIHTNDLAKLTEFVLQNNFFEFKNKAKHPISGAVVVTKITPLYVCIYMDKTETNFLKTH